MARTYRQRIHWDDHGNVWWARGGDAYASSHRRKRVRCMCQYPADKWHKKRRRRAMKAGATPKEAEIAMGW